jgi:hypothetical protein
MNKYIIGCLFMVLTLAGLYGALILMRLVLQPIKCPPGQTVHVHMDNAHLGEEFCKISESE